MKEKIILCLCLSPLLWQTASAAGLTTYRPAHAPSSHKPSAISPARADLERAEALVRKLEDGGEICGHWVLDLPISHVKHQPCITRNDVRAQDWQKIYAELRAMRERLAASDGVRN